jgi:hypothetical protein
MIEWRAGPPNGSKVCGPMPDSLHPAGGVARVVLACLAVVILPLVLSACGMGTDGAHERRLSALPPVTMDADVPEDFPKVGERATALAKFANLPAGPVLAPLVTHLTKGANRFAFSLVDAGHQDVTADDVALYTVGRNGRTVEGPYPARRESLRVDPEFESETTSEDADAPRAFYVTTLPLERRGAHKVIAVARLDKRLVASRPTQLAVETDDVGPPRPGERVARIHTPTADEVTDISEIDTRVPPTTMHDVDFADVLGKRPVVLMFSTPELCQTRLCAPVSDVVEEAHHEHGKAVEFIHMEIYEGNEVAAGVRSQVRRFRLPSEPWTFVINRKGIVADRFEGPVSRAELDAAIERVAGD